MCTPPPYTARVTNQVGRYEIVEKLGAGGAGTVYAARDPELGRMVALKLLHADAVDAVARERLRREACTAAGISHPNICQVYEVGECDGELFLTMELLEGEALSDVIARGVLSPDAALKHLVQVLQGLTALHARGFVHRDLKPANIFVTPHGTKLLDFGLALAVGDAIVDADLRLTQTGALVGTPAFMAPEQWRGETVGPATDIFAVGVLAFELLAGRPAFDGASPIEMFHAIVHEDAPALVGGPQVAALDRILQRAMAKDPIDRYGSADEMAADLELTRAYADGLETAEARTITHLLVLPFRQLRADEETAFLAEALPDGVATELSSLESVLVRVGPSADDVAAAARAAGASQALCGTVLRAGGRVRITAKLVRASDGGLAWSETLDADVRDPFALQEDLARRIAASLKVPLSAGDTSAMQRTRSSHPEAQAHYLRANQLATNTRMLATARDLYRQCLEHDPSFAPAWARLGRTYRIRAKYGHGNPDEEYRLAEQAFERALKLDPDSTIAHNLFTGFELEQLGRSKEAVLRLLAQAARRPSDPELFAGLVVACRFCGLQAASIAAERRARRLDPGIRTSIAFSHWMAGEYQQAMEREDDDMRFMVFHSLPMLGREDEAIALCEELTRGGAGSMESQFAASKLAALRKDPEACGAVLEAMRAAHFEDPEGLYHLARDLAYAGEATRPLEVLRDIVARGFHCPETFARDPWLDGLRDDREFETVVAEARRGHADAQQAFRAAGGETLLVL